MAGVVLTQVIGDIHSGKQTPRFNMQDCRERLAQLPELARAEHGKLTAFDRIRIELVGDLIEGECIYPGQAAYNEAPTLPQMAVVQAGLRDALVGYHRLAPRVPIEVFNTIGNHGKHGGAEAHHSSNFDALAGVFLHEWAADKGWLAVHLSTDFFNCHRIGPHRLVVTHQGVKHVSTPSGRDCVFSHMRHFKAQGFLQGHFHRADSVDLDSGYFWFRNGSVCGWDSYAQSTCAAYTIAQQLWFVSDDSSLRADFGWHEWPA